MVLNPDYHIEHAEKLLSRVMPFSLATVEEMEGGAAVLSGSCPFMMIRKSIASGGDELIGNIMFKPSEGRYDHLRELEEIGDSTDIWTIGGECFSQASCNETYTGLFRLAGPGAPRSRYHVRRDRNHPA